MAAHGEINPSDIDVLFGTGVTALEVANGLLTRRSGDVWVDTGDGGGLIVGSAASDGINRVDKDGNQLPLVDTSAIDKAAQDAQKAADDAARKADSAGAKADQVRADLQGEVDKVSAKVDDLGRTGDQLSGQMADIRGTVNGQQTQLTQFGQRLEGEITRGDTTVKSVSELRQTVNGISTKVEQTTKTADSALSKASQVEQTANGLKATLSKDYTSTKDADLRYSTKAELSAEADKLQVTLTETSKTAQGAMDKATTLEATANGLDARISETAKTLDSTVTAVNQVKATADGNAKSISQVADTASGLSKRTSTLEQNLSGFKSEVSQTYTPKTDFDGLSIGGANLLVNSDFSDGLTNWVPELQNNGLGTVTADKLSGFDFASTMCTINVTKATTGLCRIYQLRNPNPMRTDTVDTVSFWAKASGTISLLVGRMDDQHWISVGTKWQRYTLTVRKWNNANAFCVAVGANFTGTVKITKIMWEHASKPSAWSPAPEDLQPAGDYSTKSYVDQAAQRIALGVVQDYKGADGSGLATKSDITVEHGKITSEVSDKYATKDGVAEEISSQITQNNSSLDVKFAIKTDVSDTQSRVGNLESCVRMTSDGVRVGRIVNDDFDGYSALVNSQGSFDVLDKDGEPVGRFDGSGVLYEDSVFGWAYAASSTLTVASKSALPESGHERQSAFATDESRRYVWHDGRWRRETYLVQRLTWICTAQSPSGHVYLDVYYTPSLGLATLITSYDVGIHGLKSAYTGSLGTLCAALLPASDGGREHAVWTVNAQSMEIYANTTTGKVTIRSAIASSASTYHYPRGTISYPCRAGSWATDAMLGIATTQSDTPSDESQEGMTND